CEPTKSGFGWRGALDSRQPADFPDTEGRSGVLLYSGRALLFCRRHATKKAKKQLRRRAFAQLSSLIALWVARTGVSNRATLITANTRHRQRPRVFHSVRTTRATTTDLQSFVQHAAWRGVARWPA